VLVMFEIRRGKPIEPDVDVRAVRCK
jgi:hypothetical protein